MDAANPIFFDAKSLIGQVAEWLKAPVSKTGVPARVSRVRISPCPLCPIEGPERARALLVLEWLE